MMPLASFNRFPIKKVKWNKLPDYDHLEDSQLVDNDISKEIKSHPKVMDLREINSKLKLRDRNAFEPFTEKLKILPKEEYAKHIIPQRKNQTIKKNDLIKEFIKTHAEAGTLVKKSKSDWLKQPIRFSSNFLVVTKNGKSFVVCDYNHLKKFIDSSNYENFPSVKDSMEIFNCKFIGIGKFDASDAYYFSPINPACAFIFDMCHEDQIWTWKVVCYGMPGAPSHYQHQLGAMLKSSKILSIASNFMDDILAAFQSKEQALEFCIELLKVSNEKKLKLSAKKFEPFATATVALGLRVSKNGISLDPNKVANIRQWKRPDSMKKLSQLIGFTSQITLKISVTTSNT
jgi:hypothetical protein